MAWSNSDEAHQLEERMRAAYSSVVDLHNISMVCGRVGLTVLPHDDARQLLDAMVFAEGAAMKAKQPAVEERFEPIREQIQEYLS